LFSSKTGWQIVGQPAKKLGRLARGVKPRGAVNLFTSVQRAFPRFEQLLSRRRRLCTAPSGAGDEVVFPVLCRFSAKGAWKDWSVAVLVFFFCLDKKFVAAVKFVQLSSGAKRSEHEREWLNFVIVQCFHPLRVFLIFLADHLFSCPPRARRRSLLSVGGLTPHSFRRPHFLPRSDVAV